MIAWRPASPVAALETMSVDPFRMRVEGFFDPATWTISYLVLDPSSMACAIIDSVLDYDPKSCRTQTHSADALIARVRELGATLEWILETHVHADHLSAAPYLKSVLGGRVGIASRVTEVQEFFGDLFDAGPDFARDGSQFDRLLQDGEILPLGRISITVMQTPGHTPACLSYVVADDYDQVAFVGDTLFMPDFGTARCDFPGGDPRVLYRSIQRVLSLPPATRLFMCHDYQPGGRPLAYETTVAEQRASNIHVRDGIAEDDFVALRQSRDAELDMPVLILPAVQVNMRGGQFPLPSKNGTIYLKLPLNRL